MASISIADLTLAIVWLIFTVRGYAHGLVKEVGSLAALVLAFYWAGTYHRALAPRLTLYIAGNYAPIAAYLIIFTASLFGVWFVALAVSAMVKVTMTQWADRFFGGLFGLAKGLFVTAAVLFLVRLVAPNPDFLKGSRLVPVLTRASDSFIRYIPPGVNEKLRSWSKQLPLEAIRPGDEKKTPDKAPPAPDKKAAAKTEPDNRPAEQAKPAAEAAKTTPARPEEQKAKPAAPAVTAPQPAADQETPAATDQTPSPSADSGKQP